MLSKELRSASQIVALVGLFFSILMFIPWLASVAAGWKGGEDFLWSGLTAGFVCILVLLATRGETPKISARFGILVVNFLWWVVPLICALPFILALPELTLIDAIFEATSGLTTTGATVLTDLINQPRPILLWRSLMQWIGGLGILSLGLILLPFLRVGGMQLFRMESSDRADKPLPRLIEISKSIILIYLVLSGLCAFSYIAVGVGPFDSIAHAMTTVATGGFSTRDGSIGAFANPTAEIIITCFMFLGALPFVLYLQAIRGRPFLLWRDQQVRWFFLIVAFFILSVTSAHYTNNDISLGQALREAAFNVTSIMTGTGYASANYAGWGSFATGVFFFIMFVGGCAGSTTCGIKIFRFQILYSFVINQLKKIIYPKGVFVLKYDKNPIDDKFIASIISFIYMYLIIFFLLSALLSLNGLDFITAISGAATSISNVGPGLGSIIGPNGNFSSLPDFSKWILTIGMILGRLELFAILVLFLPSFWRN